MNKFSLKVEQKLFKVSLSKFMYKKYHVNVQKKFFCLFKTLKVSTKKN